MRTDSAPKWDPWFFYTSSSTAPEYSFCMQRAISAFGAGCGWPPLRNTARNPRGPRRNGENWELLIVSWISQGPGSSSRIPFCAARPRWFHVYAFGRGGFVYLSFPRWMMGVNGQNQSGLGGADRKPKGRAGNPQNSGF